MHTDAFALRELLGPAAAPCRRAITGESGVSLPPLIDHHVHVHLIDEHALPAGGIAGVVDLGGDPVALARREDHSIPRVAYAGAFLTAVGGYPVGRPWAPAEIAREIADASTHPGVAGGAATAVDEQASFGASVIKVSLNSVAGPALDAAALAAIVEVARERGLPVVAHAEGDGMPQLALDVGQLVENALHLGAFVELRIRLEDQVRRVAQAQSAGDLAAQKAACAAERLDRALSPLPVGSGHAHADPRRAQIGRHPHR